MKVVDVEKVIALLKKVKKLLPGKNGILPTKYFSKENMDQLIQALQANTIDVHSTDAVLMTEEKQDLGDAGKG